MNTVIVYSVFVVQLLFSSPEKALQLKNERNLTSWNIWLYWQRTIGVARTRFRPFSNSPAGEKEQSKPLCHRQFVTNIEEAYKLTLNFASVSLLAAWKALERGREKENRGCATRSPRALRACPNPFFLPFSCTATRAFVSFSTFTFWRKFLLLLKKSLSSLLNSFLLTTFTCMGHTF